VDKKVEQYIKCVIIYKIN